MKFVFKCALLLITQSLVIGLSVLTQAAENSHYSGDACSRSLTSDQDQTLGTAQSVSVLNSNDAYEMKIRLNRETLTVSVRNEHPEVKSSKDTQNLRVFRFSVGKTRKILDSTSRHVFLIVHPIEGLIAIHESGLVVRLPEDVAALRAEDLDTVLSSPNAEDVSDNVVLITTKGLAYPIYFVRSSWDSWPMFLTEKMYVANRNTIPDNLKYQLKAYTFISIHPIDIQEVRYVAAEGKNFWALTRQTRSLLDYDLGAQLSGSGNAHKNTFLRMHRSDDNQKVYVFSYDHGFAVYDPIHKKLIVKPLASHPAITPIISVKALFDFPKNDLVLVLTSNGYISAVSRSQLLDPNVSTVSFLGSPNELLLENKIGDVLRIESLNNTRFVALKGGQKISTVYGGFVYSGRNYIEDTYTLKVLWDGRIVLTLESSRERFVPGGEK